MKQVNKKYIFSNFSNSKFEAKIYKNELVINESFNAKIAQNKIKSNAIINDYFIKKFDNLNEYDSFFNENGEILQKIIYLISYEFFDDIEKVSTVREFFIDVDLKLYEIDFGNQNITYLNFEFENFPKIFKADGYLYFYDDLGCIIINKSGVPQYFDGVLKIDDYLYVDDNIIFTSKDYPAEIFIADKTELLNIGENIGFYDSIKIDSKDGKILKIFNFKDEILIVQPYKISTYNLYATKNKFSEECVLTSKIIDDTICKIDDKIVFLSTAGIKIFDGNNLDSFNVGLNEKIDYEFSDIFAFVFNDKYFINLRFMIEDEFENTLFKFDLEDKSFNIYSDFDYLNNFSILKTSLEYNCLLFAGAQQRFIYTLDKNSDFECKKYLRFNKIYFDDYKLKKIENIKINFSGEFALKIKSDVEELEIEFNQNMKEKIINLKGREFEFVVKSDSNFEVESIFCDVFWLEDEL